MLYDYNGREILTTEDGRPTQEISRRLTRWEPDQRQSADESRQLTPTKLDGIFRNANTGDAKAQAQLAMEIEEKDWESAHALMTRRAAVRGVDWEILPSVDDDAKAMEVAEQSEEMLRKVEPEEPDELGFDDLLEHLQSALLPGYAWSEIMWSPGGAEITGFTEGPANVITFQDSLEPLISCKGHTDGVPLAPNKFIFHRHRARSGDATRGGLIRPLGWMYLFQNLGIKDLLRFVEKFGMPFVSARIDEHVWDEDRTKVAYLIKNFGSDGGAVFTKGVELDLVQAQTQGAEIYFDLMHYFGAAKTKVILGQTATSGDAGGLSKGQAQENVRIDILQADCGALEATVRRYILRPWTLFNFGPEAPVPYLHMKSEPVEEDQQLFKYHLDYQVVTKNEVRDRLGLPPVEDGDQPAEQKEIAAALRGEVDVIRLADEAAKKKRKKTSLQQRQRKARW